MPIDEEEFRKVADELAVRDLVSRYCDAVIRNHAGDWKQTWAKDANWQVMGNDVHGRDKIVETWQTLMGMFSFVAQLPHSGVVQLDGDAGSGRWTVSELGRTQGGDSTFTLGIYNDEYTREDGKWCFASRRFHLVHAGPMDMSGKMHAVPEEF